MKQRYKELSGFEAEGNPDIHNRLIQLAKETAELYVKVEALKNVILGSELTNMEESNHVKTTDNAD